MTDSFHHYLFRLVARYTDFDRKLQNAYSITFGVKNNHISKYAKHPSPFHEYLQHKLFKLADIFNTHALQLHDQNAENVTERAFINKILDRYCICRVLGYVACKAVT